VASALSACPSAAVAPHEILSALARHVLDEAVAETASGGTAVVPVLVDCTAGAATAHHMLDWMRAGIRIVTCNKQFAAGDAGRFAEAMALVRARRSLYFHEATVGAGMPVISTLKHLRATGDRMRCVQGILRWVATAGLFHCVCFATREL
jgi:homoserine dehydrogenase